MSVCVCVLCVRVCVYVRVRARACVCVRVCSEVGWGGGQQLDYPNERFGDEAGDRGTAPNGYDGGGALRWDR